MKPAETFPCLACEGMAMVDKIDSGWNGYKIRDEATACCPVCGVGYGYTDGTLDFFVFADGKSLDLSRADGCLLVLKDKRVA